jgi:hypothetical protein
MSTGNSQFRACLMGAPFNTNNRGVSALAYSLVRLVKEVIPDAKISFFMGSPERSNNVLHLADKEVAVDVINYRLSPRARIQEHIIFLLFIAFLVRITPSDWLRRKIIHSNSRLRDLAMPALTCDLQVMGMPWQQIVREVHDRSCAYYL